MSAVAIVDSDEDDLADAYQTLTWIGNEISFWTANNRCIRLQYDENNMNFLNKAHKKYKYEVLMKDMTCKTQKIYIEWVQHTGKYLYYDLLQMLTRVKDVTFPLSMFEYNIDSDECIKPSFDESASPEKILSGDDIILLSPVRSFELKYTAMGSYHNNHILYLGPQPTKQFVKQCQVKYLYNCCGYSNDEDIVQLAGVKQIIFNVAAWTVGRIEGDESDEDEKDEEDGKVDIYDEDSLKQLQLAYLDKKIDLIEEMLKDGNVLIHCLAGAHRSPFITGCYEYKYGQLNGKTPKEVYKWLTSNREIVQPLGYDRWMKEYFAFLRRNKK